MESNEKRRRAAALQEKRADGAERIEDESYVGEKSRAMAQCKEFLASCNMQKIQCLLQRRERAGAVKIQ